MEMQEITPGIIAFFHPEGRSSCGMIHTQEGVVLVDTTGRPQDMQACLELAGVSSSEICLILLTHSHSDHTSGIPLFDCPVLAHKLTQQRIRKRGTARAKQQLPTETFEGHRVLNIDSVNIEIIHTGGHTPDSSVVWLPDNQVLFAGDLIFEGRYPFLATADVIKLMEALRYLPSFEAEVIVPGHGVLCGIEEVLSQLAYIESTWERTTRHIELGHSLEETANDPAYPQYAEAGYERLHRWNIEVTYRQLQKLMD